MSEHVREAMNLLNSAVSDQVVESPVGLEASKAMTDRAQAIATLAVAEQLRIGNIVALGALQIASSMDGLGSVVGDGGAFRALYPDGSNTPLHPEIARALGLEVGS